jgi:FKBP-type peptidyl-prolyl cis-trans isomerase SlyD
MKIAQDSVVTFDYTLTDDEGTVLDESGGEPLVYLHGYGMIVPGLEGALAGRTAGEQLKAVVAPADGYGERTEEGALRVERSRLPPDFDAEPGMPIEASAPDGTSITLWIVDADADAVFVSPDHPLAGVTLHFDVTIRGVRAATADELAHGHVHGPGGAH